MCQVSIFSLVRFQRFSDPNFSVFPIWLPHHVTYDVIILIDTFHMTRRTNGENFVSIRQAVAKKNTKVLRGQTDKQSDANANTLSESTGREMTKTRPEQ